MNGNAMLRRVIAYDLQVAESFDLAAEIEHRIVFLAQRLIASGRRTLILGVSGGVDSATTGRLCQLAVERVRKTGYQARFLAMRLPYGSQADEADARLALAFIQADCVLTVDVQAASDCALAALQAGGLTFKNDQQRDYIHGNIKARQRMIAQYAVAGALCGLVVGTDHAAEAVTGFFTKHGDGAADLMPLNGLTKRRVRAIAQALGAPAALVTKVPTADLESLAPGRPDEEVLGVTYGEIDDFLEGRPVRRAAARTIVRCYQATEHKRRPPITPIRSLDCRHSVAPQGEHDMP